MNVQGQAVPATIPAKQLAAFVAELFAATELQLQPRKKLPTASLTPISKDSHRTG